MWRRTLCILAMSWLAFTGCDELPTGDGTTGPSSDSVRLEVTGSSCEGNVRWEVGDNDNGGGDDHDFPWSMTVTAASGDHVSLRACNECPRNDVTITTSIFWRGELLETDTSSGDGRRDQCRPSADVAITLP